MAGSAPGRPASSPAPSPRGHRAVDSSETLTCRSRLLARCARVPVYARRFTTYDTRRRPARARTATWHPRARSRSRSWARRARDLDRIRLPRLIGPDAALYVDANGATPQAGRRMARPWPARVTWSRSGQLGRPGRPARVRDQVDPTSPGEVRYDLPYFSRMVDAQAVDCLQVDVTRCGGITECSAPPPCRRQGLEYPATAPQPHATSPRTPNLRHLE